MPNQPLQTICLIAGLATTAHAACPNHAPGTHAPVAHASIARAPSHLVPTQPAGVLYVNLQTGERTLTRYDDNGKDALPKFEINRTRSGTALFDYWMSLDPNSCWDSPAATGFAYVADSPLGGIKAGNKAKEPFGGLYEATTSPELEPIIGFDFGDLPFDSAISGLVITTATLASEDADTNNDGVLDSGLDAVVVFYDALSERNRTSIAPPTAAIRIGPIPGDDIFSARAYPTFDIIVELGDDWFELGDSDGLNRGPLWLPGANPGFDVSALITTLECPSSVTIPNPTECVVITIANPAADRQADFQYIQYYTPTGTNWKVFDTTTFIPIASPEGQVAFDEYTTAITTLILTEFSNASTTLTTTVTVVDTYFVPDTLPQAQSAFEGFGIGALGTGANINNIDWSIGGCCFWFGGLDCVGFLDQLQAQPVYNQSWYNFVPYAQQALGLLSDAPPDQCATIDLARDGLLDTADIQTFVQAFLFEYRLYPLGEQLPELPTNTADLNADGITDNADITTFIERFLACTG